MTNAVIVVSGDSIGAVGREGSVTVPPNARTVDLGDATLMPGFIDAHTHIIGRTPGDGEGALNNVTDYEGFGAILGGAMRRRRCWPASRPFGTSGRRTSTTWRCAAVDEGRVIGRGCATPATPFRITGGHCDANGYRPGLADGDYTTGIADGPEQIRAAVRYQVKYGADLIKTCATGGVLSEGDAVGATQYTYEEMKALVDEATKLDRKVAAHAHGTEGIKIAVRAGVASIEHGSFLDEEGAKMMAQRGTYLVPTLSAGEVAERAAKSGVLKGLRAQKALAAAAAMRHAIKIAHDNKVPIALGTDAGRPARRNGHEFT